MENINRFSLGDGRTIIRSTGIEFSDNTVKEKKNKTTHFIIYQIFIQNLLGE